MKNILLTTIAAVVLVGCASPLMWEAARKGNIRVTFVYSASLEIFENVWNQVGCLYIVASDRL